MRWREAAAGLALTVVLTVALLNVPALRARFALLIRGVEAIAAATRAGTAFVFGYVGGGPTPFAPSAPEYGVILAFQALPIVLAMSVLTTLLFHWGILPRAVRALAWALRRTMGVGGDPGRPAHGAGARRSGDLGRAGDP